MFLSKICFLFVVLAIWSFPLDLFDGLCINCLVYFIHMETSASPVKNCNTYALPRCVRTLSREDILSCHTCMVGHRTSVFAVSSKGAPHGRLVWQVEGTKGLCYPGSLRDLQFGTESLMFFFIIICNCYIVEGILLHYILLDISTTIYHSILFSFSSDLFFIASSIATDFIEPFPHR